MEQYQKIVARYNGQKLRDTKWAFEPMVTYFSRNDTFLSAKSACQLVENGAMAAYMDAGSAGAQGDNLASVFNFFGIPFIQSNPSLLWDQEQTKYGAEVNIFPSRQSLTQLHLDVLNRNGLESESRPLVIFYSESSDVLLWKSFIDAKTKSAKFDTAVPLFIQVPKQIQEKHLR